MYITYARVWTRGMSSTPLIRYGSFTEARKALKDILDTAENGAMVSIVRGDRVSVVADRDRLRDHLASTLPSRAKVVAQVDGWVILMPDKPFAAEGDTFDSAVGDMIANLREYAAEWPVHFQSAPNHASNWALVQLVTLSTDDQLRDWLTTESA